MTFCFCLKSPAILPIHPPDLTTCTQKCYSRSKTLFCCFFRGRLFNENVNISLEVSSLAKVCHTSHVIIMVFSFCRTSPAILTIHLPIFYEKWCRRKTLYSKCHKNQYFRRGGILQVQGFSGLLRRSDKKTNGIWTRLLLVRFVDRGVLSPLVSEWCQNGYNLMICGLRFISFSF